MRKELREEAALKQVLVLAWSDQQERGVYLLQEVLRNFRQGDLRTEAEALLTELLPKVIQDQVARGDELPAVVLVEQHRQLLMNGELGWNFLVDLAGAFHRLGLPERASRIYLFMLEGPRRDADKEALYLPLVLLFWERDDYRQAEAYAGRYLERYPQGKERATLFLWRLRALRQTGRLAEAAALLQSPGVPWDRDVELEAARILTAAGDDSRLCALAEAPANGWEPAAETRLLQAEALLRRGDRTRALPFYQSLRQEEDFAEQAAFRCAQIRLAQGEAGEGLKILRQLVETAKSPLWRKLAEETLRATAG